MISTPETEVLDFLRQSQPTPAAKALGLKRTFQKFVLEYGWWYEPKQLPDDCVHGAQQQCHKNACDLMLADNSVIYCEGYALLRSGGLPTLHSWVTDGKGRVIDNTWPSVGVAYAGVPFKSLFVTMTALRNRAIISLLDDFQNDYPLRGDLGDRPDEWLELRGKGAIRIRARRSASRSL